MDEIYQLKKVIRKDAYDLIDDICKNVESLELDVIRKDNEIEKFEKRINELIEIIHKYDSNAALELKKYIIRKPPC